MSRMSVAALLAVVALSFAASAEPNQMRPLPAKNYICPAQIKVRMAPVAAVPGGWTANTDPFLVDIDPLNPPHFSGGNMVCYYKLGRQNGAFVIYQPVGAQKCQVLSNGTGFVCTP